MEFFSPKVEFMNEIAVWRIDCFLIVYVLPPLHTWEIDHHDSPDV